MKRVLKPLAEGVQPWEEISSLIESSEASSKGASHFPYVPRFSIDFIVIDAHVEELRKLSTCAHSTMHNKDEVFASPFGSCIGSSNITSLRFAKDGSDGCYRIVSACLQGTGNVYYAPANPNNVEERYIFA